MTAIAVHSTKSIQIFRQHVNEECSDEITAAFRQHSSQFNKINSTSQSSNPMRYTVRNKYLRQSSHYRTFRQQKFSKQLLNQPLPKK